MGIPNTKPEAVNVPNSGLFGALFRVPIDYVLEIYSNKLLVSAVTLPNTPSEYEQKRKAATIITHTLGNVVRESTENHVTQIMIKGMSGYTQRLGHTKTGGVSSMLGPKILSEFDAFLNEYQKLVAWDSSAYMVFRAINEGVAFKVEPMNWEWSSNAGDARFSYRWSLELEAYAKADVRPPNYIFGSFTKLIKTLQSKINLVNTYIDLATVATTNVRGELEEVVTLIRSVGRIATGLQNLLAGVDGLRTFVTDTIPSALITEANRFKQAWQDTKELGGAFIDPNEWSQRYEDLFRTVGIIAETTSIEATTTAGLLGVDPAVVLASTQFTPSPFDANEQGASIQSALTARTEYIWRAGDTIQKVALLAYGDTARWSEIADFNGLRSPRQWGDGTLIQVGDVLSIPREVDNTATNTVRGDAYGTDILFDFGTRDISFVDNDLRLTSGGKNLEQALALRMLTEQGESYIMPTYGLPIRIGGMAVEREIGYLASHVRDQIMSDTRIRDIQDVSVLIEGDSIAVSVSLFPVAGDTITLVTPYMREV